MPKLAAIPRPTHDYIGLKPCGCVVVVIADIPGAEKITAREVADLIREGLKVERIPIADLHEYLPLGCKHIGAEAGADAGMQMALGLWEWAAPELEQEA